MGRVAATFVFDGREAVHGRVRLRVGEWATVDGVGFDVPAGYALMLISGSEGAWRFLEEVDRAPIMDRVKVDLLAAAVKDGLSRAEELLGEYIKNMPRGEPRFYRHYKEGEVKVDITDGRTGASFWLTRDLKPIVRNLPENVYCEVEHTHILLNPNTYKRALEEVEEFFAFSCRLVKVSDWVGYGRLDGCFEEYFSDKSRAYSLLAEMERDAAWRMAREVLWERLEGEGVIKYAGGILVSGPYYVSEDGRVFAIMREGADLRDALYRAYKSGKPPRHLVEVTNPSELKAVANLVAKVKPELAIIIAP